MATRRSATAAMSGTSCSIMSTDTPWDPGSDPDELAHLLGILRWQAGGRFIEQQHQRLVGQGRPQLHLSSHAERQVRDRRPSVATEPGPIDQRRHVTLHCLLRRHRIREAGRRTGTDPAPARTVLERRRAPRSPSSRGTAWRSGRRGPSTSRPAAPDVARVMSIPPSSMCPWSTATNPEQVSSRVVLPAPFDPMMPTISPWASSRSTELSACTPPKRTETSFTARIGSRRLGRHVGDPPTAAAATRGPVQAHP